MKCINVAERNRAEVTAAAAKQASGPQISESIRVNLSQAVRTLSFKRQADAAGACTATANVSLLGDTKHYNELVPYCRSASWSEVGVLSFFFFLSPSWLWKGLLVAFDLQKMNKPRITWHSLSSTLGSWGKKERKAEEKIIIFRLSVCRGDSLSERAKKKNYSSLKLQHGYSGQAGALADLNTSH